MNNKSEWVDPFSKTQPIERAELDETEVNINLQPEEAELIRFFEEKDASAKVFWEVMWMDPDVRESFKAVGLALINMGISIADFFPGVGDAVSLLADAAKWTKFDTTPDVPKWLALGSEGIELVFGGSHLVETTGQILHDIPQIKEGANRMKIIYKMMMTHNYITTQY